MVVLLRPYLVGPTAASLVVFRAVYYLLPLAIALVGLLVDELWQRRTHGKGRRVIGQATERITPSVLAIFTFVSGVVLLFSGATPGGHRRLERLDKFLPLGVIEVSHFLGSVAGHW